MEKPAVKKGCVRLATMPAVNNLPVVTVKKGTAQASCCHRPSPLPRLPRMQEDHKVFAHHDKWGTFQVPKAFLNMNNNAPAAVAPKAVRQASGAHACSLPLARHSSRSLHCYIGFRTCVLI